MDHGDSLASIMRAIHCGFSSVMIDGSLLPFEENIALTNRLPRFAIRLGYLSKASWERSVIPEPPLKGRLRSDLYSSEDAQEFIEKTGIDTLAVAIGTAHGIIKRYQTGIKNGCLARNQRSCRYPIGVAWRIGQSR